jgi:hypothetical protein
MAPSKNPHFQRNVGIAAIMITVIAISTLAIVFTQTPEPTSDTTNQVGLNVGDTFSYKLTGSAVLGNPDATIPEGLSQYNDTDYYQVTVTAINGTQVLLSTTWKFNNGSQITRPQIIDLSTGARVDPNGFWAIYYSDLNVKDLLHPRGTDGLVVNGSDTQIFGNVTRARNYWITESQFVNASDTSGNTMRDVYVGVYFDKQTGILEKLTHIEFFTNPEVELIITWELTGSSVWNVGSES